MTDPVGLFVMAIGVTGAISAGTGFVGGGAVVFGNGDGSTQGYRGFSGAWALTFGFPLTVYPSPFAGAGVSVDLGLYWGLQSVCEYGGPFVSLNADVGEFGWSLVWSVPANSIGKPWNELLADIGMPVGLTLSANFDLGLPPLGVSAFMTWSWLYGVWGCRCQP
jgi:hypothetical protein